MRPYLKSPKQRYSCYVAVLNIFMLLHMLLHAVSVFYSSQVSRIFLLVVWFSLLSNISVGSHLKRYNSCAGVLRISAKS